MSQVKNFVISEFTNPSGEIVLRVSGWLDGKSVRKNFPTRWTQNLQQPARLGLHLPQVRRKSGVARDQSD
jgi:hypothetical protein